jgi:nitrogen-specific signal transduction histidine kinase
MSLETPGSNESGTEALSFANTLRDCLVCGALFVDGSLATAALSPETARLLGLGSEGGLDVPFGRLPARLQEIVREALASGRPIAQRQVDLQAPSGAILALCVSAAPVGAGKKTAGVALVVNDLAPARRLEAHIEELDRLANLGTLAASLAHEIKNALVAGKTLMDLLLEKHQDAELVGVVRRELDRIDTIVTRMLKFGGPSRPAFSAISLHEVL